MGHGNESYRLSFCLVHYVSDLNEPGNEARWCYGYVGSALGDQDLNK